MNTEVKLRGQVYGLCLDRDINTTWFQSDGVYSLGNIISSYKIALSDGTNITIQDYPSTLDIEPGDLVEITVKKIRSSEVVNNNTEHEKEK